MSVSSHLQIMGVVNTTPDSFSDGGRFDRPESAIAHARQLIADGADIIDIGGESTRPGATRVEADEEIERTVPLIQALRKESDIAISIDTSKAEVMRAAVAAGATMINDIWALRQPGALEAASALGVPVCLMHMQGTPETMQQNPVYDDVVAEVREFLAGRIDAALGAGIARDRIIVDPGFGFGKTIAHNLTLLNALGDLRDLGVPLLVGLSRKSMIGKILEDPTAPRLYGSIALAVVAALHGADVVRVHDVAATADAVAMLRALRQVQS